MHNIDLGWVWHDMSPVVEKAQGVVREHAVAFRPENLCPVLHGFTDKTTVAHADRVAEQQYAALVGRVWIDDITFPRTCIITGVEEVTEPKATALYPNPTSGQFTLELLEESHVTVYNMLGQRALQLDKVSGIQHLDLGNAPKGMYFIQIQSGSQTEVKKIIVE